MNREFTATEIIEGRPFRRGLLFGGRLRVCVSAIESLQKGVDFILGKNVFRHTFLSGFLHSVRNLSALSVFRLPDSQQQENTEFAAEKIFFHNESLGLSVVNIPRVLLTSAKEVSRGLQKCSKMRAR